MYKDLRGLKDWMIAVVAPLVTLVFILWADRAFRGFTGREDGPLETMQAVIMFMAVGVGVSLLRFPRTAYPNWVRSGFLIGVVASLYIALEEISYGQRIFGWVTPELWDALNDQGETNLHNTSDWLDQKPRLLLEIGVIIGGIIVPILRNYAPKYLPVKWAPLYPHDALFTTAMIATMAKMYERIMNAVTDGTWHLVERHSELQEFYFFYFILLYFIFMRRRYRKV